MKLLKKLCSLGGASGDELIVKKFLLNYIIKEQKKWKVIPKIIQGHGFQDCFILVFGKPKVAIFAHMDVIGFTVGYNRKLIKIGGPDVIEGIRLVGKDSKGKIDCELMVIDKEDGTRRLEYIFEREIERGTNLTYKQIWKEDKTQVQSCYMDNRLGIWNALKVAETLKDGAICFSCFEEHGGGTAGYLANYLFTEYKITSALISDITWVTEGVEHGKGVALSMRDGSLPSKRFVNKIIDLAKESKIPFQLEVESAGGSDGTDIQKSIAPVDWMFIGAPESNVHTPFEMVYKKDILSMVRMYTYLMKRLHS